MTTAPAGSITFDRTGDLLGPDTAEQAFADSPITARAAVHHGPSLTSFTLADHQINGARFRAVITFTNRRLARIELGLHLPNDSSGWAGWSLENELHRKRAHEAWAEQTFSTTMSAKPILFLDRPSTPPPRATEAPLNPAHPTHAVFEWGEVISLYDDRAASSTLRINYNPVP